MKVETTQDNQKEVRDSVTVGRNKCDSRPRGEAVDRQVFLGGRGKREGGRSRRRSLRPVAKLHDATELKRTTQRLSHEDIDETQ